MSAGSGSRAVPRCAAVTLDMNTYEYTTGFRTLVKMKGCPCPTQSPISWRALCTALSMQENTLVGIRSI